MSLQRLTKSAALGLTVAAFTAPAASAMTDLRSPDTGEGDTVTAASQDLRSPDARTGGYVAATSQDLRSPDARVVGNGPGSVVPVVDMRTPDSRDAGEGRGTFNAPEVVFVEGSPPQAGGLDWGDAGIGAGALIGMIALGVGGAAAVGHRKRGRTATIA
jgi:hypothetical protein